MRDENNVDGRGGEYDDPTAVHFDVVNRCCNNDDDDDAGGGHGSNDERGRAVLNGTLPQRGDVPGQERRASMRVPRGILWRKMRECELNGRAEHRSTGGDRSARPLRGSLVRQRHEVREQG